MTLSEITPHVVSSLQADPFLAELEIIANVEPEHNRRLEAALREKGLALVVVQSSGAVAGGTSPRLLLQSEVVISVLENPLQNSTGKSCLQVVEHVLGALHQAHWASERGLRNTVTVDTPAYEAGPLDSGLIIYFCNFQIKTIQQ